MRIDDRSETDARRLHSADPGTDSEEAEDCADGRRPRLTVNTLGRQIHELLAVTAADRRTRAKTGPDMTKARFRHHAVAGMQPRGNSA